MNDTKATMIRVLLVDDEEDLVEFLALRLVKRGFQVAATTSGPEALKASKGQKFDVAILDLKMPHMDGIEVLRHMRTDQPFLQAIMLTGHGSHDSALEAGRLSAYRYLIKPYDFEELTALIREAYESKRKVMHQEFQRELAQVMQLPGSAREIRAASDKLRAKYEQD